MPEQFDREKFYELLLLSASRAVEFVDTLSEEQIRNIAHIEFPPEVYDDGWSPWPGRSRSET